MASRGVKLAIYTAALTVVATAVFVSWDDGVSVSILSLQKAISKSEDSQPLLLLSLGQDDPGRHRIVQLAEIQPPVLIDWIAQRGIALRFDVTRNRELSDRLGLNGPITLVLFRATDDAMLRRVHGSQALQSLQTLSGRDPLERWREQILLDPKSAAPRLALMAAAMEAGSYDLAADQLDSIWRCVGADGVVEQVNSTEQWQAMTMLLLERYPPMREKLIEWRKAARAASIVHDQPPRIRVEARHAAQWCLLSAVLEPEELVAWCDAVITPQMAATDQALVATNGTVLEGVLFTRRRYRQIGWLYADPLSRGESLFNEAKMMVQNLSPADPGVGYERSNIERSFIQRCAIIYVGLLAAEREAISRVFAEACFRQFGRRARVAFVVEALDAAEARPEHMNYLAPVLAERQVPTELSNRLRAALGGIKNQHPSGSVGGGS